MNTKKGKASTGQGIVYGAREAGRGAEHFEIDKGPKTTHGSRKHQPGRGNRKKTSEQRITSG